MSWIYIVLVAQFLNAFVILWDKYLVTSRTELRPAAYAFYVAVLSGSVLVLVPFGLISLPDPLVQWLPIAIGLSYIFSILLLYEAIKVADASDVTPVVGAMASVSIFLLSGFFLERLMGNFFIAFILLVTGTIILSYFRFTPKLLFYSIGSGILFGISLVLTKIVFSQMSFIDGFFWSRIANVFGGLLLLLWPANRQAIIHGIKMSSRRVRYAIIANKALAGLAFLLILIGINLGNVSIVNALSGVQFIFILILAVIFSKKLPAYVFENVHRKNIVLQKVLGITLIFAGLVFLFL